MNSFTIGLSGISVNQALMDLIGQNLTNASNPAYHRRDAILAELTNGSPYGSGIEIAQVRRLVSDTLERAINSNTTTLDDATRQLQTLLQVQAYLAPGSTTGSLQSMLETFFNDAQQLSLKPDDLTRRAVLLGDAQALTNQINSLTGQLGQLGTDLTQESQRLVTQVNRMTSQIAELNGRISTSSSQPGADNGLLDRRDALIAQLAQVVNVRAVDQGNGVRSVFVAGMPLVIGTESIPVKMSVDSSNRAVVVPQGSTSSLVVSGGQLGAVLTLRNQLLPQYQGRLDTFKHGLVQALDSIQARGLGLSGPMTTLTGERAVSSTAVPLSQAGLAYPPKAGSLFISVTNLATGQRVLHQINIDPSTQSLQQLATAISAVPNLQAIVNNQTGKMTVLAQPGYGFDFAGRLSTTPDAQAITGTTVPQVSGSYTGGANEALTFTVAGSGTIGVSANLALEVRDSAGTLLNSLNIGQGYEPGSGLPPVNGVSISLSAGTANAGDSFTVQAVANPDTAGITTALGLNSFFSSDGEGGLQVNPDLLNAPGRLALSSTGAPGDGGNLLRIIGLRDQPLLAGNTQTLGQSLADFVGIVADRISSLNLQQATQQSVGQSLQAQQQAISGVDPNEELVKLLQYQRGFQMSSKYISVVNETLASLLSIT